MRGQMAFQAALLPSGEPFYHTRGLTTRKTPKCDIAEHWTELMRRGTSRNRSRPLSFAVPPEDQEAPATTITTRKRPTATADHDYDEDHDEENGQRRPRQRL